MPKFSIVIVNTNSGNLLSELIESFRALNLAVDDFEFIVVDNDSSDGSLSKVNWGNLNKRFILQKYNYGYTRSVNKGIEASRGRYIVLINPDVKLFNNIFEPLEAVMLSDESIGICGPKRYYPDGREQFACFSFPSITRQALLITGLIDILTKSKALRNALKALSPLLPRSAKVFLANFSDISKPIEVPWMADSCSMIKREVVDRVGLHDENFFIYHADEDFCLRARLAGYKTYYVPGAKIIHHWQWKRYAAKPQELLDVHYRDMEYFYNKHYHGIRKACLLFLNKADRLINFILTPKLPRLMRCPICNASGNVSFIEQRHVYRIYECPSCRGQFSYPLDIEAEDYKKWYKGEAEGNISYESYLLAQPHKIVSIYKKMSHIKLALRMLGRLKGCGRLLDVGCSQGAFCKIAKDAGFDVYGIEPSLEAVRYASGKLGIVNIAEGTLNDAPAEWHNFYVITAFEVIEHLDDPREMIIKAFQLLKGGGYFLISTPNNDSLEAIFKRRKRGDYPPHHLMRWRKQTLRMLLEDVGFSNVIIKNTPIDRVMIGIMLAPGLLIQRGHFMGLPIPVKEGETCAVKKKLLLSPLWFLAQRIGDALAFFLNIFLFNFGSTIVVMAQKPSDA